MTIPFRRFIKLNSRGKDVLAIKRALKAAGYSGFTMSSVFGENAQHVLKKFQTDHKLPADGVYGQATHKVLSQFFDARSVELYLVHVLHLPATFTPTHQTDGLPGYPAIDELAPGGTFVAAPIAGVIRKHSGHAPTATTSPGGPYGWSQYLHTADGTDYFLTHFSELTTTVGEHVQKDAIIGVVADYAKATHGVTPSHIHEGRHAG